MTDDYAEVIDRLQAAHREIEGPSIDATRDARARLREAIAATTAEARPEVRRASNRGRRKWALRLPSFAAAGAFAAVAAVAVLPSSGTVSPGGGVTFGVATAAADQCARPPEGKTDAGSCLAALAAVADEWQLPGRGGVAYVRTWSMTSSRHYGENGAPGAANSRGFQSGRAAETDVWIAPDGSGKRIQHGEGPLFLPSAADREAWETAGKPSLDRGALGPLSGDELRSQGSGSAVAEWKAGEFEASDELFPVGEIKDSSGQRALLKSGRPESEFSADPDLLRQQIASFAATQRRELSGGRCEQGDVACLADLRERIAENEATLAVALLQYPGSSMALRGAVLEVLSKRDGYEALGTARDRFNREGTLLRLPQATASGENMALLSLESGRLLGLGIAVDGTLRTTRWLHLFDLELRRVEKVGDDD